MFFGGRGITRKAEMFNPDIHGLLITSCNQLFLHVKPSVNDQHQAEISGSELCLTADDRVRTSLLRHIELLLTSSLAI